MISVNELKWKQNSSTKYLGLTKKEVEQNFKKYGPNKLIEKVKVSPLKIFLDQFKDFMVLILLASTLISMLMGENTEAITIIAIVIINSILGFIQEYRTEKSMEALKNLSAPTAKVIRDGETIIIPAAELVPGDVIMLEAGDRVPADSKLIQITNVSVDESLLTGESVPVNKTQETNSNVFMGTIITQGKGIAVVYATGMSTEMGKIADMLQSIEQEQTPLQRRLDQLGKYIGIGCLAICTIVSITGILRGQSVFDMFVMGISLAVAAVPEGLPAIVTIALALGVQRMLKRNALVKKLPAVETLGCSNVICSDKTGTLTENKMTVKNIYTYESLIDVTGNGYTPDGNFIIDSKKINPNDIQNLKLMLEIAGVCNNSEIYLKQNNESKVKSLLNQNIWDVKGDPTEGALLVTSSKCGLTKEHLDKMYFKLDEIPFDSDRKCMSVICKNFEGTKLLFTKGAPDVIIDKCKFIHTANGVIPITNEIKNQILKSNDYLAEKALRVIGISYKKLDYNYNIKNVKEDELIFVGLMGMIDPPRSEAIIAVKKCRKAGIKTIMITGDHKITATSIAKQMGIFRDGDSILTGKELDVMPQSELEKIIKNVSVFARVSPKHKLLIVKTLKKFDNIVAMTGDGVNDAPAIKEADIGVSMGISGTDVTKESSAMILLDDNFATLVAAIEEGRVIYSNIRKFIRYLLSCNIGEVLTMFIGMLIGLPNPLIPIQILWINLVTDGLPAIALGFDPPVEDVMTNKPRGTKENIFSNGLLGLILFRGVLIGFCTLIVFITLLNIYGSVELARTGSFLTLVLTQLIHVFECKSEKLSLFKINIFNNISLILAVISSLIMILAAIYVPFLQNVFNTVPLNLAQLMIVIGVSMSAPIACSFLKE